MSYYKVVGLNEEPFSTSPDPFFFYESKGHKAALYRLRVALELRRGLSVILGDVGTGKTTLSRRLSQLLKDEPNLELVMVLNPMYENPLQFLADLLWHFHLSLDLEQGKTPTMMDCMIAIEHYLFRKCVEEGQTVVLLIDESQKLCEACFEILRALLNYETNQHKTLQLILMGQMELLPRISRIKNFWDRIAFKFILNPFGRDEVKEMINFRLAHAGYVSKLPLFSDDAIRAVYDHTQGYPRKISLLCHDALEYLVMYQKEIVDRQVIDELIQTEVKPVFV